MKILKVVRHLGVDKMLKAALGSHLTLYRPRKNGKFTDPTHYLDKLPFEYVTHLDSTQWDIIIQDDIDSVNLLEGLKPRHVVWYVHGTYHLWQGFQMYFNEKVSRCHVLFTDWSREGYVKSWYRGQFLSQLILPVHLTDEYYTSSIPVRNGRIFSMGNDLSKTCSIYGYSHKVEKLIKSLTELPYSIYGFNNNKFDINPQFYKGAVTPIRQHVANYSASVHPSFVPTCSFVLLECMAAGVPVIATPKASLPVNYNRQAYVLTDDPDEMLHYAKLMVSDSMLSKNMGKLGRDFLRETFPWKNYVNTLRNWIGRIYEDSN